MGDCMKKILICFIFLIGCAKEGHLRPVTDTLKIKLIQVKKEIVPVQVASIGVKDEVKENDDDDKPKTLTDYEKITEGLNYELMDLKDRYQNCRNDSVYAWGDNERLEQENLILKKQIQALMVSRITN